MAGDSFLHSDAESSALDGDDAGREVSTFASFLCEQLDTVENFATLQTMSSYSTSGAGTRIARILARSRRMTA